MEISIMETRKTVDDFVKLLLKMPEKLRDNAYFTVNGMLMSYECEKTKERPNQPDKEEVTAV
ncbi:MAG: hypothetical protein HFE59_10645 [Clostridiales bacterium]|nr:hypothetical protein [Clostridiales bacterium]